jgi:putative aldouronate transport system permease protein
MNRKRTTGEKVFAVANFFILLFIMVICLYPIWHVLMASISDNVQIMRYQGILVWPKGFDLGAYSVITQNPAVLRGYFNTFFVVIVGSTVNIVMTSIAAYVLSRKDFMLTKPLTIMVVITMYFSGGLVPFYFTVKDAGLDGSLWALIIPTAINAFYLIILKTSFLSIPESLEEAAKVDGARHIGILFKIVFPLSMPTIAVLILYYGVDHWNEWFNAMIFLRTEREKYPLQLVLREILLQNTMADSTVINAADNRPDIGETVKYSLIVVSTVPILCVYPFLQRYFVKGVMVGSVKE